MWIKKIELYNIGAYEGQYIYDFDSSKHINIILGENGNGKTTLLNSIICCLFGTQMFGSNQITQEYKEYIESLKNRNSIDDYFYIQMEFKHDNVVYVVKRSFKVEKSGIVENIQVKVNDIEKKDFKINKILSQNLIKLFFFNGETILSLINNNKVEKYLDELIVQAFEMDIFLQLEKDLEKKNVKEYKKYSSLQYNYIKKEYEKNQKEIQNIETIIMRSKKEYELAINNIEQLNRQISTHGLLKENDLKFLISKEEELKKNIKYIKGQIDDILNRDLNYLLHFQMLNDITYKLDETRNKRLEQIQSIYRKMDKKENVDKNLNIGIALELEIELLSKQKLYSKYGLKKYHELNTELKSEIKNLNKVRANLSKNQKGFEYINLVDNLQFVEDEKSKVEKSIFEKDRQLKNLIKINNELLLKIQKEEELILSTKLNENAVLEQEKLEKIIKDYKEIKLKEIYTSIEKRTLDIGKKYIFRKNYLIDKITINKGEVIVYSKGKDINLKTFSSGEKQAIIVSLILAVIYESKLDLPLVLDTFIARLDAQHTNNLLKYFKENISNQIIFLVTDKEMTKKEYEYISDSVGTVYTLKNDGYKVLMKRGYNED